MSKMVSLCLNTDFRRAYYKGRSFVASGLITYVLKNRLGINRIGITTSKKIGIAVKRNRARRVIRAAYSALQGSVKEGYDIVFVARSKTTFLKSDDVLLIMKKQLKDAGVLN